MEVLNERVNNLDARVTNHDFLLMGNPKAGVKGILTRFDELVARMDEREHVELSRHHDVMRSQSKQMILLTVVGIIATMALLILSWFTYLDASRNVGSLIRSPRPAHSLLHQPSTEARRTTPIVSGLTTPEEVQFNQGEE